MRQRQIGSAAAVRSSLLVMTVLLLAGVAALWIGAHGLQARVDGAPGVRPAGVRLVAEAAAAAGGLLLMVFVAKRLEQQHSRRVAVARLDAMMSSAPGGLAVFDGALRCLRMNEPFADLLEETARARWSPDLAGSHAGSPESLWDLLPGERALLEPAVAAVLERGERPPAIAASRVRHGLERHWLLSLQPLPRRAGEPAAGFGLTALEVTAQRAAERRLAFQLDLEKTLCDVADPLAMKQGVCELIARRLGASQASYAEVEEPSNRVVAEGGWSDGRVAHASGRRQIADYDLALWDELRQAKLVTVADVRGDPRISAAQIEQLYRPRGIAAFAMILLAQRGGPAGIVLVSDATPRRWSEDDIALLRDAAGRLWSSITRGRAEMALRESEQRFFRAVTGAGIGIWDWDIDQNEVMVSRGFLPLLHQQLQGAVCSADQFLESIHEEDRERMAAALHQVAVQSRSGENFFYEAEYRTVSRSGTVRWLRSQGRVTQRAPNGQATRLSGVTVEVTDRRQAQDALTAAQDRLRMLNQDLEAQVRREVEAREQAQIRLAQTQRLEALAQLSGGIAHDFNNVLQAITGSLALMQRRAGDAEVVRQLADMAGDAAARGGVITARLLSFARQGELQPAAVPVAQLLGSLRDMLEHMLGAGITLRMLADETLPPLFADKGQLEAVLVNLALNARDAMQAGGELTISAQVQAVAESEVNRHGLAPGAFVHIAMTDTGVGMKPAVLARASEPFFTTKPVGQGTGLGLAMARGFAEQSGGAFHIASRDGEGTTVSIWLPLAPVPAAVDRPPVAEGSAADAAYPGRRTRLLLVDDDPLVREVLAGQMEDLGYGVTRAHSGPAALARLDAGEAPDIMITDYAMPGLNGAVLLAEARRRLPHLPVLLLTGFADSSLRLDMAEWDANITLLLRKPVSSDALAKAASTVLQGAAEMVAMADERG
jgi:signal transduction histidine kinase/ActR/RegA family two-component response regulator